MSFKLSEVQSSINWQSSDGILFFRIVELGWTRNTAFSSSGRIRFLMSNVALQSTRTCSVVSRGAEQSLHEGSWFGLDLASLSPVQKSPVSNFTWLRNFLAS